MKILFNTLFWALLLFDFVFAQNYLWPTNASHHLTSSFCEYRPGHYHSAIDIKTWNKEGYPIYAIENGRIFKIRVSPFGYGKVIYLLLDDGNYAVYAHLQRFTKEIDKVVREKQLVSKKYRLNWYPKKWKVKKGDILGYTGSTGIGTPHLHFEIRNSKEQPLNPLAFYDQVKDNIRPRLQKLSVIPLGANSVVNNSYLPQRFDLTYIKDGIYVIKKPINVKGKIGLAIKGYDQADGVHNKFAFYQTTMNVEGKDVFNITYDKMDFASTSFIDTEIYYPFRSKFKEVFHKLYIEPFNILQFYKRFDSTDGTIMVEKNPVSFEITVKDYNGNTSKIVGELIPSNNDNITIKHKFKKENWFFLKFSLQSYNFLSFSSSPDLKEWKEISYFEILERKFEKPQHTLFTKFKLPDSADRFVKITTKSFDDRKIEHLINITEVDSIRSPTVYISDKKLIIETNRFGKDFKINSNGKTSKVQPLQDMSAISQYAIPVNKIASNDFKLGVDSGDSTLWFNKNDIGFFLPNETKTIAWFDSSVTITSHQNSFYDTALVQIKKAELDSHNFIIPIINEIFEINPVDLALRNNISVRIIPDSVLTDNWSVYKLNGGKKLSFISSKYDSLKNEFLFRTKSFGKFSIAQDTLSPELKVISPIEKKEYSKFPGIRFITYDDQSGIGSDENISITVDSQFVLPEWDPEEKTVNANIDNELFSGEHVLEINVKDLTGNVVTKSVRFFIK